MSNRPLNTTCGNHGDFQASYQGANLQTSLGLNYWQSSREGSSINKLIWGKTWDPLPVWKNTLAVSGSQIGLTFLEAPKERSTQSLTSYNVDKEKAVIPPRLDWNAPRGSLSVWHWYRQWPQRHPLANGRVSFDKYIEPWGRNDFNHHWIQARLGASSLTSWLAKMTRPSMSVSTSVKWQF